MMGVTSAVAVRLWCVCCLLLLQFVGVAFGEGTYQRTKDGKTIVWNANPKPGDTATWFGDRDADGYATKIGTLTWYTARGTVYARFRGNMVRGKFNGSVNGYSKGITAHAVFVDGQKASPWSAGTAATYGAPQTPPPTAEKIAKETTGRNVPQVTASPASSPINREHDIAASRPLTTTPAPQKAREETAVATTQPISLRQSSPPNVRTVPEPATPAASPNVATNDVWSEPTLPTPPKSSPGKSVDKTVSAVEPIPLRETTAPSVSVVPAPTTEVPSPNVATNDISSRQTPPPAPDSATENAPAPGNASREEPEAPAEAPRVITTEHSPSVPSPAPVEAQPVEDKPAVVIDAPEGAVANQPAAADTSVMVPNSAQPAATPQPVAKKAASPHAAPRLSADEVIKIANAEVRKHGFNRADYRRDEPEFNANSWSVAYDPMTIDGTETAGQHFSVVIDDRTRGAVFVLRK